MPDYKYHRDQITNAGLDDIDLIAKIKQRRGQRGMFCQRIREPVPTFEQAPCEKVVKGKNNSFIVLGRDRHASLASGYGGRGMTQCGMIDLVVGRGAGYRNFDGEYSPPGKDTIMAPNFYIDAARIYISQKCNIDEYFGLAIGSEGTWANSGQSLSTARSGIGIKADHVRVMGRRNIKLITGRAIGEGFGPEGDKNSKGGTNQTPGTIDFIVGNYTEPEKGTIYNLFRQGIGGLREDEPINKLQPIPKGENLIKCIEDLHRMVVQTKALATANAVALGSLAGKSGLAFATSARTAGVAPGAILEAINAVNTTLKSVTSVINDSVFHLNYLNQVSPLYINSKFVRTT
jgi:hypothetical protein